jgi:hypothetical protein
MKLTKQFIDKSVIESLLLYRYLTAAKTKPTCFVDDLSFSVRRMIIYK